MMPEPGRQKSMPYFFAAEARKANTSWFSARPLDRSAPAPSRAWIRWSQWMEEGRVVRSRPAWMNWRRAIWAVASCMATRSGRSRSMALPRSQSWASKSTAWAARIFSARVTGRPKRSRALALAAGIRA